LKSRLAGYRPMLEGITKKDTHTLDFDVTLPAKLFHLTHRRPYSILLFQKLVIN
jgi:hypothetical protein